MLAMDFTLFSYSLPMLLISSILFLVTCLKLVRSFRSCSVKGKLPPGPWRLPIIGSIHHIGRRLPHPRLRELSEKYGSVMLLQLGEMSTVVVSSAEAAKEVLKTKDHIFGQRPFVSGSDIYFYGPSNVVLSPTGDYWKLIKKMLSHHLLNAARVRSFQSLREEEASNLVKCLNAEAGSPVNLTEKIFLTAGRIVSRSAFRREKRRDDKQLLEQAMILVCDAIVSMSPDIAVLFPSRKWLHVAAGARRKYEELRRRIDVLMEDIVAADVDDAGGEEDCLLSALLNLKRDGELTMDNVKAVLLDVVLAGFEPGSRLVEWGMAEMVRKPTVLKKAQQEVRHVLKNRGYIDESDLEELKYFRAVIKETLRLHPPAPLLTPRLCTQACEINGYTIPIGTQVFVNVWAIARDPEYWTSSLYAAEEFAPERFIDSSIDYRGLNYFEYIPFGGGKRGCPGILYGPAIGEILLANLLCYFDWQLPSGITPETLDMTELMGSTIKKKDNLILVPIPHHDDNDQVCMYTS